MWIPGIPNWLLVTFVLVAVVEAYFFFMQRAALHICRDNGMPPQARLLLLPGWYRLAWLAIGLKWGAVVLIFLNGGWLWAVAAMAFSLALKTLLPVPFSHFLPILSRHLDQVAET